MYKLNKYKLLILVIIIFVIFIIFALLRTKFKHVNDLKIVEQSDIKASDIIKDRFIYESTEKVTIGKNLKEIENGYYDVDIKFDDNNIAISFNKLYKEEYSKELYVDEKYLMSILILVNKKFNICMDDLKLQEMTVLICDKYMEYKNDINKKIELEGILSDKYRYVVRSEAGFLVLDIKLKY